MQPRLRKDLDEYVERSPCVIRLQSASFEHRNEERERDRGRGKKRIKFHSRARHDELDMLLTLSSVRDRIFSGATTRT